MRVVPQKGGDALVSYSSARELRHRKEKLLVGVKRSLERFVGKVGLVGEVSELGAAEIGDIFRQREWPVDGQTGERFVARVLLGNALSLLRVFGVRRRRKPIAKLAVAVVLVTIIVEGVRKLVARDGTDAPVVQSVCMLESKMRALKDCRGERERVLRAIVERVGDAGRCRPGLSVESCVNGFEILGSTSSLDRELPVEIRTEVGRRDCDWLRPLFGIANVVDELVDLQRRFGPGLGVCPRGYLELTREC